MNILNTTINNQKAYSYKSKSLFDQMNKKVEVSKELPDEFIKNFDKENKKRVVASSIIGSLAGIAVAVGTIFALARGKNPAATLKNLHYEEPQIIAIGAGSILGGLAGGLLADKNENNKKEKLREASQQFFGNVLCPVGILAASSKLLEKSGFRLPQINSSSKPAKIANAVLSALPRFVVTVASLVTGMEVGNAVMNKVNNKVFKEEVKHDVNPEDYLMHADDLCLTANMLLKDAKTISRLTSKVIPLTFIVAGSKTGMKENDSQNPIQ